MNPVKPIPGNDVIRGGDENDGAWKNDVIFGGPGNDELFGEDGNDNLGGGPGDDFLFGEQGDDRLTGLTGTDFLDGGIEDDGSPGKDICASGEVNEQCENIVAGPPQP